MPAASTRSWRRCSNVAGWRRLSGSSRRTSANILATSYVIAAPLWHRSRHMSHAFRQPHGRLRFSQVFRTWSYATSGCSRCTSHEPPGKTSLCASTTAGLWSAGDRATRPFRMFRRTGRLQVSDTIARELTRLGHVHAASCPNGEVQLVVICRQSDSFHQLVML